MLQLTPPLLVHACNAPASASAWVAALAVPHTKALPPPVASAAQEPLPENSWITTQPSPPQRVTAATLAFSCEMKLLTMVADGALALNAIAP